MSLFYTIEEYPDAMNGEGGYRTEISDTEGGSLLVIESHSLLTGASVAQTVIDSHEEEV